MTFSSPIDIKNYNQTLMIIKKPALTAFCCHFIFLAVFALVEFLIEDDFVRWRLDWVIFLITIISSIVFIQKNNDKGFPSKFFKFYFILYLFFAILIGVGAQFFYYSPIVAESNTYTVHRHPGHFIDEGSYVLYKKVGLLEKRQTRLTGDGYGCTNMVNFKEVNETSVSFDLERKGNPEFCDRTGHYVVPIK